jgi:hypothetical protein
MTDRLIELARKIECQAWNRRGTDETWVLDAMRQRLRFEGEIRATSPIRHAVER